MDINIDYEKLIFERREREKREIEEFIEKEKEKTIIPKGYEIYLSNFGIVCRDSCSGEAIAWGFSLVRRMGSEKFDELRKFGRLKCISGYNPTWYLATIWLTKEKAIEKYGQVTKEDKKIITFGNREFFKSNFDKV